MRRGISRASLAGKPKFHEREICDEFLDFVGGATLVAHNAAFDRGFMNHELERAGRGVLPEARWRCTYELAKRRFPGMYNSLDALCKRFKISLPPVGRPPTSRRAPMVSAPMPWLRGPRWKNASPTRRSWTRC